MSVAGDTSLAGLMATPGVAKERDPETRGFQFQQTMLRIKDPQVSLDFYTRVMGMTLLCHIDVPSAKFSIYFVGYQDGSMESLPEGPRDRIERCFDREATLELTHNWGTEGGEWRAHSGNTEPRGFGHIGVEVPDVYVACERFERLGVEFQKTPDGGSMKGLAFIKDPDGYWIEIFNAKKARDFQALSEQG